MRKNTGWKTKLEEVSYQATAKGGSMQNMLKSLKELNTALSKLDKKQKK